MDKLTKKTIKTSRGYTYTYYTSPPATPDQPTLLLCHGFPDEAAMWSGLISAHLSPAGYGIIAPDLLGYSGTDKPVDPSAFVFSGMTRDLADILDAESVTKVISTGHDWGAGLASRFWTFHPDRCAGLITFNVAYIPKYDAPFSFDAMRPYVEKQLGYFTFWYWKLFANPKEGPEVLGAHLESAYDLLHPANPELWRETLCKEDGVKEWCLADKHTDIQEYAKGPKKEAFVSRMKRDGFASPLCWYRVLVDGHVYEDEKDVPREKFVVDVPYLFVAGAKDLVCVPGVIEGPKQAGLLKDLTVETVDAAHWCMHEKPDDVGKAVLSWLEKNFGPKAKV